MTETDLVRNLKPQTIEIAQSVAMTMDSINALNNDIAELNKKMAKEVKDINKRLDALEKKMHGHKHGLMGCDGPMGPKKTLGYLHPGSS